MSRDFVELLIGVRVIPVLTIANAAHAVPLAKALVRGGLNVLEVTFRTGAAVEAIRRIAGEVPEAVVGAGTINQPHHFKQVPARPRRWWRRRRTARSPICQRRSRSAR